MAEAYLRLYSNARAEVYSAGVETHGVNPLAIATMKEDGIDISNHTSNHIDEYAEMDFDLILTVCDHAKERCPFFPSHAKIIHQNFKDPAKAKGTEEEIREAFRQARKEIKDYCRKFISEHLLNQ